jgi:hypothetical protein
MTHHFNHTKDAMAKAGRKIHMVVHREPNGRASRARDPIDKLALEVRARMLGISVLDAKNQLAATFIGRLHMQYQAWEKRGPKDARRPPECLSYREYSAAIRFLDLHNDRLKVIQAHGAQYETRARGDSDIDAVEAWASRVNSEYVGVRKAIQEAQGHNRGENLWAALDYCILRDQPFSNMVGALRILCNSMARHWKIS